LIRLMEAVGDNTHGSFYMPLYVGLETGAYTRAGLTVDLDSVAFRDGERRLAAGEADLLVAAPMRTMRLYELTGTRIVSFTELASRQPFCIFAHRPAARFKWQDLEGNRLINFGSAETPILCLRYVLKKHGVRLGKVSVIDHLTPSEGLEAFRAGAAKYMLHPLDTMDQLISQRRAHLVAPLAPAVGHIPFTTWAASPKFLRERRREVAAFSAAHDATLRWISTHSSAQLARLVKKFFPGVSMSWLVNIVERYQSWGLWPQSGGLSNASLVYYRRLLASTGWIEGKVPIAQIATVKE
jgi:ABC-type nitrate/sulfonate/bicarbonate transport system substrate-binding protein